MLVLVTYDVNTETKEGRRRLRKVAKMCVNFGQRVQNSVFECILDAAQYAVFKSNLTELIDEEKLLTKVTKDQLEQQKKYKESVETISGAGELETPELLSEREIGEALNDFIIEHLTNLLDGNKQSPGEILVKFEI